MAFILGRTLSVIIAFLIALYLRQEWLAFYLGGPSKFTGYPKFLVMVIPLFLFMFYWRGVFSKSWSKKTLNCRISEGVLIHLILLALATMIAFYQQYHLFSRTFMILFVFWSFVLYAIFELFISSQKVRARKVLTAGSQCFFDSFKSFCKLRGLKFVFLGGESLLKMDQDSGVKLLQRCEPDEVLICSLSDTDLEKLKALIERSQISVQIRDMTSLSMLFKNYSDFEKYENYLMQFLFEPHYREYSERGKRFMDLALLFIFFPIWFPLILLVSLALKLTQERIFFRQSRVGQFGKVFSIVKFCSMKPIRADQSFAKSDGFEDKRLTKYGWLLRRTSIDELPQLWNIIKGEMSLVGPRPELVEVVIENYDSRHWKRSLIKPGLTGLWQIYGRKQPIHDHLKYDFFYLKNRGILFDLYILIRTIPAIFRRTEAV